MTKPEAREIIMAEVAAALADNDYLTVSRIFARLSRVSLDVFVGAAVEEAIRKSGEVKYGIAAQFARRHKEIRELMAEARRVTA